MEQAGVAGLQICRQCPLVPSSRRQSASATHDPLPGPQAPPTGMVPAGLHCPWLKELSVGAHHWPAEHWFVPSTVHPAVSATEMPTSSVPCPTVTMVPAVERL